MSGLFRVSEEEIERCAGILERLSTDSSFTTRKDVLERLRPTLSKLQGGNDLLDVIRVHLDTGDPAGAAALVRSHDRTRSTFAFLGKGKKWIAWVGGAILIIGFAVVTQLGGGIMAKWDGSYEIAMGAINSCKAATEQLGEPIEQRIWGRAAGSSEDRQGQWGTAQWSIPVAGPKGSGQYSYAAEMHGGAWQVLKASLDAGGEQIPVVPCGSEWLAKTIEAAKKSKPLLQSFGQVGTVAAASGRTSVKAGDRCDVSITPDAGFMKTSPTNCRVVVKCGPKVVYGWEGSGYTNCETDRGLPTRAADPWGTAKDTDPIVEVDLPAGRVVVRDDNPDSTYSIEIVWPMGE